MKTALLSSLGKIFPDELLGTRPEAVTVFENEPLSFQLAYRLEEPGRAAMFYPVVESALPVTQYRIGYVPVVRACPPVHDGGFDRTDPGLYPDPLYRRKEKAPVENDGRWGQLWAEQGEKQLLTAVGDAWQGLWLTVNERGDALTPGEYTVTVRLYTSENGEEAGTERLSVRVLPGKLPEQELLVSNWFHCDCLADHYGVEMFSPRHFEIIGSFLKAAAEHGQNMVLLPAFTPPLDTSIGKERRTAQLVGVRVREGKYEFDFTLLKSFVRLALTCGITHFEHSHLFTQWGAEHAPKIVAEVDGEEKRIFGWETDVTAGEYERFLTAYFAALRPVLEELGIGDKIYFHVSDEPDVSHLSRYLAASEILRRAAGDVTFFDAMSHYSIAETGATDIPVVMETSEDMEKFIGSGKPYWVYYTGGQITGEHCNRLISCASVRNRMLGIMMYAAGASGFLHWGYNFWYDMLSHGAFDPNTYPGTYNQMPGTSFIVYPAPDGTAIPSLRMKVFAEGMRDYRALRLLEEKTSREYVLSFIEKRFGVLRYAYPMTEKALLDFREELNREIAGE